MRAKGGWTPTESRILAVLADGEAHPRAELFACLNDDLGKNNNLAVRLHYIRRKLPRGQTIITELSGRAIFYRHVMLLKTGFKHNITSVESKF